MAGLRMRRLKSQVRCCLISGLGIRLLRRLAESVSVRVGCWLVSGGWAYDLCYGGEVGVYDIGIDFGCCFTYVLVDFEVWDGGEAEEVGSTAEGLDDKTT